MQKRIIYIGIFETGIGIPAKARAVFGPFLGPRTENIGIPIFF